MSGINLTTPIIKTKVINRINALIFTFIYLLKKTKIKKKKPIIIIALFRESKIKFKTNRMFPTIINNWYFLFLNKLIEKIIEIDTIKDA